MQVNENKVVNHMNAHQNETPTVSLQTACSSKGWPPSYRDPSTTCHHPLPHPCRAATSTSHLPLPLIINKGFTCFRHCEYLIQTKVSVSLGDSLAEAVRERVQHAVVWVH